MFSSVDVSESKDDLKSAARAALCSSSNKLILDKVMLAAGEVSLSFSAVFPLDFDIVK